MECRRYDIERCHTFLVWENQLPEKVTRASAWRVECLVEGYNILENRPIYFILALTCTMSLSSRNSAYPNAELFSGIVQTTMDALRLVEAAREGRIPRIIRRLNSSERQNMIKSGAVFVFSVEESGIKRWTDTMLWSPSRIDGNFLVSIVRKFSIIVTEEMAGVHRDARTDSSAQPEKGQQARGVR